MASPAASTDHHLEDPAADDPNGDCGAHVAFDVRFLVAMDSAEPASAAAKRICAAFTVIVLHEVSHYYRWLLARKATPRAFRGLGQSPESTRCDPDLGFHLLLLETDASTGEKLASGWSVRCWAVSLACASLRRHLHNLATSRL
jgi:hypothetical protein